MPLSEIGIHLVASLIITGIMLLAATVIATIVHKIVHFKKGERKPMSFGHLIKNEVDRLQKEKEEAVSFEDALKKLIDEYGAPENITDEIKNYLIGSGNVYAIIELAKEKGE